jgi:hypothetical protein
MTTLQANDYNWTVSAKTASYVLVAADAGTRITMSNAGATTITVNTALFTAGDTLTITNIGAGACTITAGTATVSTAGSLILNQYDSGTLYFSSASAAIWNGANPGDITGITTGATSGLAGGVTSGTASLTLATAAKGDLLVGTGSNTAQVLTVGSNNQTLVADSTASTGLKWATPATAASGLTLVSSSTMSAVNSKSMDNVFTSTYDNYQIQISFVPSGGDNVSVTMRASGADNTTSNYDFFNMRAQYGGTVSVPDTGLAQSKWTYMGSVDGTYYVTYVFDVMGPNLARNTTIKGRGEQILTTTGYGMFLSNGNFRASTVFDGIKIALNGAPTMTGEIRVYGYQKS